MKKVISLLFFVSAYTGLNAQVNSNICYPQNPPTTGFYANYTNCDMQKPVRTLDKGYVFSFFPWTLNLHGLLPSDYYTIKTDSNFVPQWKKPYYAKAIPLPTGGIILIYQTGTISPTYYSMHIEKVTQSGVQVWIKNYVNEDIVLCDGVNYSNKLRFVGRKRGNSGAPSFYETNQPYTVEMDTLGNFISQSLYNASSTGDAYFSKIKRDALGNFFVYSSVEPNAGSSIMILAKFNSSFNFLWGKTCAAVSQSLLLTDLEVLAAGSMIATGMAGVTNNPAGYSTRGVLLKFDPQGNLLVQNYFDRKAQISGLCKKPNGNYVVSNATSSFISDSLFLFETDTSTNIQWHKYCYLGISIGSSLIKGNSIYTPMFRGYNPILFPTDLNGINCATVPAPYTKLNSAIQLSSFSLNAVTSPAALGTGTVNIILPQNKVDSCSCAPTIQSGDNMGCIGNTITVTASATGSVSWFTNLTGSTVVSATPGFTYYSATPTVAVFYVQSQACPYRMPVSVNIIAVSVLTVSPPNPTVCAGQSILLTVTGAGSYTWSNGQNTNQLLLTPSANISFSVSGSATICPVAPSSGSIAVYPTPLIQAVSNSTQSCSGESVTLYASGGLSYIWNNQQMTPSVVVSPTITTTYIVTGTNANGCSNSATVTQVVSICAGVPTIDNNFILSAYPNPCSGEFVVHISDLLPDLEIQVLDSFARNLLTKKVVSETTTFDLTNYPAGIYYLSVNVQKVKRIYKWIKE